MEKEERKAKKLTEEQIDWFHTFLECTDITYINLSKKDYIYMGKANGVSQYTQKQNLLWTIRDLLGIIN